MIRKANARDFIAIAALDRGAWKQNALSEFIPDGEHVWRIWCEHALVYVSVSSEDEITGAIVAFPCLNGTYCLHKVMIAESCRGQGLGSKLFAALFEDLDQKNSDCFLTVDPANENAIKLYRKWGFSEEVFVADFYREKEDRFVLTRPASSRN